MAETAKQVLQDFQSGGAGATSTPGATDPSVSSGMPTYTVGKGSKSKTFGGIPTKLQQGPLSLNPGPHVPGLSPEDQGFSQGANFIPAYKDGDQWLPGSDPNPDTVRGLQIGMIQAGLLEAKATHLGIWDAYSADAYSKVLAQANVQGVSATVALDNYIKSEAQLPKKQLSPDDLQAMGNNAAQVVLGRDLNPDELNRFTAAFQSAVAQQPPTTQPGADQLVQNLVRSENPRAAAANSLHNVSQRALAVLTNPAVSLPAVQ